RLCHIAPAELPVQGNQHHNEERGNRRSQSPDEELLVSEEFLQPTTEHAGEHHAKRHEPRADRVMRRAVWTPRNVDHIEQVSRETESVTELLDANCDAYEQETFRLHDSEEDIDRVRQVDGRHHP